MLRIALITMPAQELDLPSLSLTQLQTVVGEAHGDRVSTSIHYVNHEFARYLAGDAPGTELYDQLCANQHTGLPDWLFRQVAFPELADNAAAYFRRYYPGKAPDVAALKDALLARRDGIAGFLDALIEREGLHEADIVGFTTMFAQNVASIAMARRIKRRNPDALVLMGGANCEVPMGGVLVEQVSQVDYVFSGPALKSFPQFVGHLLAGERDRLETIPGVFGKAGGERPDDHRFGVELPIDADVALDYSAFFASHTRLFGDDGRNPHVLFETSRGCWWGERSHCTFCGLNGATMSYRSMEPDRAVTLINSLFERYGDVSTEFFCVDNILPKPYPREVLPRLKTPEGARLFYEVKANLTEDELQALSDAQVRRIQPGIEALSTKSLKLMRKGSTSFVNIRLLMACVRHDIEPVWNLLTGFPGETEDVFRDYAANLERLVHLWPPQGVAQVRYDRYSPYFMQPDEFGLKLQPFDFYSLIYPFGAEQIERMAYFFNDTRYDAPHLAALSKWMQKLWVAVQHWRTGWDAAERPQLAFREQDGRTVVHDTRGGTPRTHDLGDAGLAVLEALANPRPVTDLQAVVGDGWERELQRLDDALLIWREGDRAMSLVLPAAPSSVRPEAVGAGAGRRDGP